MSRKLVCSLCALSPPRYTEHSHHQGANQAAKDLRGGGCSCKNRVFCTCCHTSTVCNHISSRWYIKSHLNWFGLTERLGGGSHPHIVAHAIPQSNHVFCCGSLWVVLSVPPKPRPQNLSLWTQRQHFEWVLPISFEFGQG